MATPYAHLDVRFGPMNTVRVVGRSALLLEAADQTEVTAWYSDLRRRRAAGEFSAVDIVPGARTVLLDGVPDAAGLAATLRGRPVPTAPAAATGRLVRIPTVYDGADLDDVAERWRTTPEGVVDRHTSIEFRVAFCGFAPGFAYLTGLPPRLRVPRHTRPRTSVPAGSVALADEYAAVYPAASPGGWRLLGRTDLVMFDLSADPPNTLRPGTRVRFHRA